MKQVVDLTSKQDKGEGAAEKWVREWKEKPKPVKEVKEKKEKQTKELKVRVIKETKKKEVEPEKIKRHRGKKPVNFSFKIVWMAALVVVMAAAGGFLWSTLNSKLFLSLRLKQEPLELHEDVELNTAQTVVSEAERTAPAMFVEDSREKSQSFKATGVAFEDRKAQGIIKIYNNSNPPSTLTLREGTRFLSSGGGKIFKAVEKVALSAPTKQGSKITPSVVQVKVMGQDVGEDYNIGPSKFSVPGLAGTPLYYVVWGESEEPMIGGSRKEVAKISAVDTENARNEIYKTLKDLTVAAIRGKAPAGYTVDERVLIEDNFDFSCVEPIIATTSDAKDLNFTCSGKLSLKALIFKMDDLKALALSLFSERKPANKDLRPESLQISLVPKGAVTQSGHLVVSLAAGAKTYEPLNQDVLLSQILGKDKARIERFIADGFPQIDRADLKFWPFWIKKAPSQADRIKIRLTF